MHHQACKQVRKESASNLLAMSPCMAPWRCDVYARGLVGIARHVVVWACERQVDASHCCSTLLHAAHTDMCGVCLCRLTLHIFCWQHYGSLACPQAVPARWGNFGREGLQNEECRPARTPIGSLKTHAKGGTMSLRRMFARSHTHAVCRD